MVRRFLTLAAAILFAAGPAAAQDGFKYSIYIENGKFSAPRGEVVVGTKFWLFNFDNVPRKVEVSNSRDIKSTTIRAKGATSAIITHAGDVDLLVGVPPTDKFKLSVKP